MASIQYVVTATDAASAVFAKIGLSADGLDKQLADLGKRIAEPEVGLKDTKFTLAMLSAAKRLDKLNAMIAEPGIKVDTAKVQLEILRVNAMLDRATRNRTVDVKVDVGRSFLSRLGGLFGIGGGGAAAAAGGGGQGIGGLLSALGPYGTAAMWGIGGGLGAALLPALLPALLGGGIGGIGALGGIAIGAKDRAKLLALQKSLAGVTGTTASANARRDLLQNQIAAYQQSHGAQLAFGAAGAGLLSTAQSTFFGALTARPLIQPGGTGPGTHGQVLGQSFLQGLIPIFRQIERFTKSMGPDLGDLFRASLPFLQMFVKSLEQAGKILLPVFTQSLRQMQPFLPMIGAGLLNIVQGIAGMIKAMGPGGMKASAEIFVGLCRAMEFILIGVGHAADWLAKAIMISAHGIVIAWHWLIPAFEDSLHWVRVHFNEWRHGWAHDWDSLFNDTVGVVIRNGDRIVKDFNNWLHDAAVLFDRWRHDNAHVWDLIWNDTIGRVIRGGHDVEARFNDIRAGILSVMNHLPGQLWNLAATAVENIIKGAQSVVPRITGFFSGFAHGIVGIFHKIWGWFSPSAVMFQGGQSLMEGLEQGIKAHAHKAIAAASSVAAGVGGKATGSLQTYAQKLLNAMGWGSQWPAFNDIVMRESGWNVHATNPSSGAYGIPQALPASKMASAGADWATSGYTQLRWMMGYIRSVYGSPNAAWGHEMSAGWYDRGGWLPPGLSLALNTTGAPERVGGGGTTINLTVNVPPTANPRETARQIVGILNQGATGGVKLRGSIIGPG